MGNETRQLRGGAMLMLTALIWGTAFVAQSVGMDYLGPCAFTATRNFIGCVALLPVTRAGLPCCGAGPAGRGRPAPGKKALFGWAPPAAFVGRGHPAAAGRHADRFSGKGRVF